MKSNIFKLAFLSIIAAGSLTMTSCIDESLNVDPKHPSELPSQNFLSTALYQFSYYTTTPSVNFNNYNFFVQQWAETTYTDETNYNLVTRNQPRNHFNRMFVYTIGNIKKGKLALTEETGNTPAMVNNKLASLEILEIVAWENLVNTFGNVPYSESFTADSQTPNYNPKYDDAKTIYIDLISRLDKAIASIDKSEKGYVSGDIVYYGDMQKWIETANAIKLRLGLNLADTDNTLAKKTIESAVASGVYQSNADGFIFKFSNGTFSNPVFDNLVASGRNDFVPSELIINTMKTNQDPRISKWFTEVTKKNDDGTITNLGYKGGVFGSLNAFGSYSHLTEDYFLGANAPAGIISYTEVAFLLAEAAQRGYSVGGTAQSFYVKAIEASMLESGVTAADITAYLAVNPYDAANWKKSIGTQAWVSLFNRGYAGWNFTRRLDFPVLTNPTNSLTETVPYRMPYSDQEYVLNKTNVEAAATAIGGDKVSTKLFWDKY